MLMREWKTLFNTNQVLLYEGYTYQEKPCGSGKVYFPDGTVYQEGVFGIKGLLLGREYYENGNLRFEGFLRIHFAYGPNPPVFGRFCDPEGNELFFGKFSIRSGGVGYPMVVIPEEYASMRVQSHPKCSWLIWEDMDRELIEKMRDNLNRIKKPKTSSQLTRMIDEIIQKDDMIIPGIRKSTVKAIIGIVFASSSRHPQSRIP